MESKIYKTPIYTRIAINNYYKNNKEKILEKAKQRRNAKKVCISLSTKISPTIDSLILNEK